MSNKIPPAGYEELVEDGDEGLMYEDDKEQEINESRKFCPLCAKYKDFDEAKFVDVQTGPVRLVICGKCNIVLHNLNVILTRARQKVNEKAMKIIEESKTEKSNLIIPGRNLFLPKS